MELTAEQFVLQHTRAWVKINSSDFGYRERKFLLLINGRSFGQGRLKARILGDNEFIECGAVTHKHHVRPLAMELAKAKVLEYRQVGRGDWEYQFREPFDNWDVKRLVTPAWISEQLELNVFQPDLYEALLRTYIGNHRILPNRDGRCTDRGSDGTAGHELEHDRQPDGKGLKLQASSETANKRVVPPPGALSHQAIFSSGQTEVSQICGQEQKRKEEMDKKNSGSAGNDQIVKAGQDKGGITELRDAPELPPGASSFEVTKNVTSDARDRAQVTNLVTNQPPDPGGGVQPGKVTNLVTNSKTPNVDGGVEGEVTKKVPTPVKGFPPVPLSKPIKTLNVNRSTLNGPSKGFPRRRKADENALLEKIEEHVGFEDVKGWGGSYRKLIRNSSESLLDGLLGELRYKMKQPAGIDYTPGRWLIGNWVKMLGFKKLGDVPPGPPPI